jgi:hypothetical protein
MSFPQTQNSFLDLDTQFSTVSVLNFLMSAVSHSDNHVTSSRKRWATAEQTSFLESKIPDFLKAQPEGCLIVFWTALDKAWFTRWPERASGLHAASPDEYSLPLSERGLHAASSQSAQNKVPQDSLEWFKDAVDLFLKNELGEEWSKCVEDWMLSEERLKFIL